MNTKHYLTSATQAFLASILIVAVLGFSFFLMEPKVGQAVVGTPFTIKQTITDEISFSTQASNVVATTSINGVTGGTSNGSTTVTIKTNSNNGYYMTIAFYDNGSTNAMIGDVFAGTSIRDYGSSSSTVPDYTFSTASTSAVFAYTVTANNTSDLDPSFLNNGSSACDIPAGARASYNNCWMGPATTGFRIIDRSTEAPTGATSTLYFRVHVPNSPTPSVTEDVYTATATLTAINN